MQTVYLFIISGCLGVLGLLTLLNNPKQKSNLFFFFVSISAIGWIWTNYLSNVASTVDSAILYNKFIFVITSLLIYCLYLFSTVYPTDRFNKLKGAKTILFIFTIITLIADFSPYLVGNVEIFGDHSSITFGYGISVYLVHFAICLILFIINIVRSYRKAEGVERIKIQYLLLGIFFSLLGAGTTNLILPIFIDNFNLSNVGPAFLLFFIGFTTISMIRYRLFGIKFLLAQILRMLVLTVVPALSFYFLIYVFKLLSWDIYSGASISLAIGGALIFSVIYGYIINKSQTIFLGKFAYGGVNPQDIISKYAKDISVELDIAKLSQQTIALIKDLFYVNHIGIFVFKKEINELVYQDVIGFAHDQIDTEELHLVTQYWDKIGENKVLIKGELQKEVEFTNDDLTKRVYALMEANNTNVIVPLNKRVQLNGLIIMGAREDKRDLTVEELKFLEDLVINTSVAMGRAILYKEVEAFNQTLQSKVDAQTAELQIKVKELQEARNKENDMIDIMGHELRTPATIVKLNAQLLEKFTGDIHSDPEAYRRYVDRIKMAVENEIKLINTLLSSAKLEGDKIVIDPEEVDIKEEIEMAIHGNERDANEKNLPIIDNSKPETPHVYADKARVVEILNNLISNAVKYTNKGSITIEDRFDDNWVEISIIDTGNGISAEDLPKLGQKFYRAGNHINSDLKVGEKIEIVRPGGTGLGLFVTFNLIRKMGGDIRVESELGKGSKFVFVLPRYKAQAIHDHDGDSDNMFEKLGLKKQ